ncbi:NAD(P)H-dependent oxidoreductase [Candidatus Micrarchaeota archaeon CG1_02_55_22]|nr:MAG: NAD(P)H-dependent oxidoreductase [Candidatus Micrarchaeota archaeon CG1_02_55_22]
MEFKEIVESRYATKEFDGHKVDEKTFNELLELVRLAPSSYNLQPWKIRVVSDEATKKALSPFAYDQKQISSCSHLLVFCADTDVGGLIDGLTKQMAESGAPAESVKGLKEMLTGFSTSLNEEQKLAWAQRQVYLALGNCLNGAKSLGLDSCPMEGFDPAGFAKTLNLPKNLVPTVLCPIGYAADTPKPKQRFPLKEILA